MGFLDDPPRPLFRRVIHDGVKFVCRMWVMIYFRARIHGAEKIPRTGGMIICSNHASNLDPVIIGSVLPRRVNYLAKISLSRVPGLGWLIDKLDAIPIHREAGGVSGMKETLRRLKRNESVLVFVEGSRSDDGTMQPVQSGICALVNRVESPVVPVAISGTFESLPRGGRFPWPRHVVVVVGDPIADSVTSKLKTEEITKLLEVRIGECLEKAQQLRTRQ